MAMREPGGFARKPCRGGIDARIDAILERNWAGSTGLNVRTLFGHGGEPWP
jgi:hypothetical protein